MRADELIALAASHGIDLQHVAGNASDTHGPARQRRRTLDERRRGAPISLTVKGPESQVYRKPYWSAAELGQAACNVPRMPWLAACYSIAGDLAGQTYKELHRGLMVQALRIATREDWVMRVRGTNGAMQFYVSELAQLVLDADRFAPCFTQSPALYPIYMSMEPEIWETQMAGKYLAVKAEYERWIAVAKGMIRKWIVSDGTPIAA